LTPTAEWLDGGTVHYIVERHGERLNVPVRLHRLDLAGILRALANTMRADLSQWSWFMVALIVFFLRPNNRAARLLLVAGTSSAIVTKAGWAAMTVSLDYAPSLIWLLNWVFNFYWGWLFFPSLILLLLSFPLPLWPLTRFPRLTPALFYAVPLGITAFTLATGEPGLATALLFVQAALILGAAIAAIVQVFRHKRNRVARAQVSWVAFGIAISIGGTLTVYLLELVGLTDPNAPFWSILNWPVTLALPACLAIAILRYRLFDINLIIRKTAVYAVLSASLALIYFGAVIFLQAIFAAVTDKRSPLIVVLSTLLIAALFGPLRRRVQTVIDRRFFRQKVDAQQALARFTATARAEVELEALTAAMLAAVQETLQPEALSLWLKPPPPAAGQQKPS
jgi:hypothetical protein